MPVTSLIADVTELRKMFNIPADIKAEQLSGPLRAGRRELKSWVSEEAYDDAASDDEADDQERRAELDYAEALLAMGFAVVDININISPDGILKSNKEEGSITKQNLTPKEALELQEQLFSKARLVATPHLRVSAVSSVAPKIPTVFCVGRGGRGRW